MATLSAGRGWLDRRCFQCRKNERRTHSVSRSYEMKDIVELWLQRQYWKERKGQCQKDKWTSIDCIAAEKIERNNLPALGNFIGRSRMIRSTMFSMQIEWEANALRFKILWNERYFWVMIATSILKRKKGKINERQIYIDRLYCSCCRSMRQHDAHHDTPFQDPLC